MEKKWTRNLRGIALALGVFVITEAPARRIGSREKGIPRYAIEAACADRTSKNKLMCGYQAEANLLAITIATECRPEDVICAGLVYETAKNRREIAENKFGRSVSLGEILTTPKQFSGLNVRYKAGDVARIMESWVDFALAAIAGKLQIDYPPATHYAMKEVIFKTTWGKEAIRLGCELYELPDGHVAVGRCGDGYLPFRLP